MRVALVHDWLVTYRGGEQVLEALAGMFPEAPIFTLFHEPGAMPDSLESRRVVTSVLDRIPGARARHRQLLPFFPWAIRQLDVGDVDLVISSSHCAAKAVRVPRGARHLSYVHAPLRYMWDRFDDYFGPGRASAPLRIAARVARPFLRSWDVSSAAGVDRFVANSAHVARLIAARYGRVAQVVHPPVQLQRFQSLARTPLKARDYFVVFGALAPYKRVDLAIEAFRQLGWPLKVGGTGAERERLRASSPANVEWLGQVDAATVPGLFAGARALVFPGEEDFGLVPVEAQACGTPVVALGRGGALETVTKSTGVFFGEPSVASLVSALQEFERRESEFDPAVARAQAAQFSSERFVGAMREQVRALMNS